MRKSYEKSFSLRVFFSFIQFMVYLLLVVSCDSLWFCRCMHGDSSIRMSTVEYAYSDRRQIRCASQFCHHTKPNMNMKSKKKEEEEEIIRKIETPYSHFNVCAESMLWDFLCVVCGYFGSRTQMPENTNAK